MALKRMAISEIKARSRQSEPHWFDRKTMRMFGTKLHGQGYVSGDGKFVFFVTSEKFGEHAPRTYRVRMLRLSDGSIRTAKRYHLSGKVMTAINPDDIGTDMEYHFLDNAQDLARRMARRDAQ